MTCNALLIGLDSIRCYNIPNERVFVVLSSELRQQIDWLTEGDHALLTQLTGLVPGSGSRLDMTLTPEREVELFTAGTLPRQSWPTTSALNIGTDATTADSISLHRLYPGRSTVLPSVLV